VRVRVCIGMSTFTIICSFNNSEHIRGRSVSLKCPRARVLCRSEASQSINLPKVRATLRGPRTGRGDDNSTINMERRDLVIIKPLMQSLAKIEANLAIEMQNAECKIEYSRLVADLITSVARRSMPRTRRGRDWLVQLINVRPRKDKCRLASASTRHTYTQIHVYIYIYIYIYIYRGLLHIMNNLGSRRLA